MDEQKVRLFAQAAERDDIIRVKGEVGSLEAEAAALEDCARCVREQRLRNAQGKAGA